MMAIYATVADVQSRMNRTLSASEQAMIGTLLEDAGAIIDAFAPDASDGAKKLVSCRMVIRQIGDGEDDGIPIGATQGSMSGLGYAQSWTVAGGGASGEMYLGKLDKQLLGIANRVGSYSPTQELVPQEVTP